MNAQIVSFHCVLKNKLGRVISSTYNREVMTGEVPHHESLLGLAKGLQNLKPGEKRRIALSADEAYGFYDQSKVHQVHKRQLTGPIRIGQKVLSRGAGQRQEFFTITQIHGDQVVLDANHPLAGQDLVFEIEATEVREATEEELRDSLPMVEEWLH